MTDPERKRAYDDKGHLTHSFPGYVGRLLDELVRRKNAEIEGLGGKVSKNAYVTWLIVEEAKREKFDIDAYKRGDDEGAPK